jgi:hypothetical protein
VAWAQVGLQVRYPGTIKRKNRAIGVENPGAEAEAQVFFSVCVSWSPPYALDVTGDLDKEGHRVGRRGNNLGEGLTGCGGLIDEQPREGFSVPAFPLLSSARPKSRGS